MPLEDGSRPLQGPGKHKRSSDSTPDSRQAKRLTHTGQMNYAKAAPVGMQMDTICDGYPEVQV